MGLIDTFVPDLGPLADRFGPVATMAVGIILAVLFVILFVYLAGGIVQIAAAKKAGRAADVSGAGMALGFVAIAIIFLAGIRPLFNLLVAIGTA